MTFRMVLQKFIETIRGKVQRTQNLETEFWRFFSSLEARIMPSGRECGWFANKILDFSVPFVAEEWEKKIEFARIAEKLN